MLVQTDKLAPDVQARMFEYGGRRAFTLPAALLVDQLHENAHWTLARAPLNQAIRLTMLPVWAAILELAEGRELVVSQDGTSTVLPSAPARVPLSTTEIVHGLDRGWSQLVRLHEASTPVEEIFAVWASLHWAVRREALTRAQARRLAAAAKRAYGATIPDFAVNYDRFATVADLLDYITTVELAVIALSTREPLEMLTYLVAQVAAALDRGDPVESVGGDRLLEWARPRLERDSALFAFLHTGVQRQGSDAALWFWRDLPEAPIMCTFDENGLHFPGLSAYVNAVPVPRRRRSLFRRRSPQSATFSKAAGGAEEALPIRTLEQIPDWFWFESLRQQLTQGVGLQCPYWDARDCCGRRATLEGLLKNTRAHAGFEDTWRPLGCLDHAHDRGLGTAQPTV